MNAGDLPGGRIKASITRASGGGIPKAPGVKMAKVPHDGDMSADRPSLKPYGGKMKFLGSFKYGGPVKRTGLYLVHAGEHVKSPFSRRSK